MHLRHLGYACQNVSMPCTTGRTLRLANLTEPRVAAVIGENLDNLLRILRWNALRGIRFFRISSGIVPFASHEAFPFDWRARFAKRLEAVRAFAADEGMRLSMHPGQYTVLNSPRADVVDAAIAELEYHASFLEAVDPAQGTMTLHVGGAYGDKEAAVERFAQNAERLSERARARLTLENDDKTYSLADVLPLCERLGLPLVFDYFHHLCHHAEATPDVDLLPRIERVAATWGTRVPKFHLSSPRPDARSKTAHADLIAGDDFDAFAAVMDHVPGGAYDLMLEAKRKDEAVLAIMNHRAATADA